MIFENIIKLIFNFPHMHYIDKNYWDIALVSLISNDVRQIGDTDKNQTNREFLKDTIGLKNIQNITWAYKRAEFPNTTNALVKSFFDDINSRVPITGKNQNASLLLNKPDGFSHIDKNIFDYLTQSYTPETKLITSIDVINGGISCKLLSEGEKRLILVKAVLDIVADENSLVLFDEPDSHIHEMRKRELLEMMQFYSNVGRQIVLTTHSPTLASLYNTHGRIMLEKTESGTISVISQQKIDIVAKLTNGIWTTVEQNIFFTSNKPLVITEGVGDFEYIKKAIDSVY